MYTAPQIDLAKHAVKFYFMNKMFVFMIYAKIGSYNLKKEINNTWYSTSSKHHQNNRSSTDAYSITFIDKTIGDEKYLRIGTYRKTRYNFHIQNKHHQNVFWSLKYAYKIHFTIWI